MAELNNRISARVIAPQQRAWIGKKDLKPLISDGRDENISSDRKITEYWYEVVRAVGRAIL